MVRQEFQRNVPLFNIQIQHNGYCYTEFEIPPEQGSKLQPGLVNWVRPNKGVHMWAMPNPDGDHTVGFFLKF